MSENNCTTVRQLQTRASNAHTQRIKYPVITRSVTSFHSKRNDIVALVLTWLPASYGTKYERPTENTLEGIYPLISRGNTNSIIHSFIRGQLIPDPLFLSHKCCVRGRNYSSPIRSNSLNCQNCQDVFSVQQRLRLPTILYAVIEVRIFTNHFYRKYDAINKLVIKI